MKDIAIQIIVGILAIAFVFDAFTDSDDDNHSHP
jgi:hypothetical protein